MKGIIVEKNQNNSVLLLSDGTFRNIKKTDLQIGSVVFINDTPRTSLFYLKKLAPMIAAAFVVVFLGTGVYAWTTPVQYINIDINPSVELSINRFDRIIQTKPLNNDGEKLLENAPLKAKKLDSGINEIIDTAKDMGYLSEDGDVLISISSSDLNLQEKTQAEIEEKVEEKVEILTFDTKTHDLSSSSKLSPGRDNMINRVIESGTSLSREELAEVPVRELMGKIKENRKLTKELEKEAKEQQKVQASGKDTGKKENDGEKAKGGDTQSSNQPSGTLPAYNNNNEKSEDKASAGTQKDNDKNSEEENGKSNNGANPSSASGKVKDKVTDSPANTAITSDSEKNSAKNEEKTNSSEKKTEVPGTLQKPAEIMVNENKGNQGNQPADNKNEKDKTDKETQETIDDSKDNGKETDNPPHQSDSGKKDGNAQPVEEKNKELDKGEDSSGMGRDASASDENENNEKNNDEKKESNGEKEDSGHNKKDQQ